MKPFSIVIGIPAYNEEANIGVLLSQLSLQKQDGYSIDKVIVCSDGSSDKTVEIARKHTDLPISVISLEKRVGKAKVLNVIISKISQEALVILDADVAIKDRLFFSKLVSPIVHEKMDLCAGKVQEIPPTNLIEKILFSSMQFKQELFKSINKGSNIYTCHGRVRAFSKRLYKAIKFKESANEDAYSYLFCVSHKFSYRYIPDAVVLYRLPQTIHDHELQSVRFFQSKKLSFAEFGEQVVNDAYFIPKISTIKIFLTSLLNNPFLLLYILLVSYLSVKSRIAKKVQTTWSVANSSKKLEKGILV